MQLNYLLKTCRNSRGEYSGYMIIHEVKELGERPPFFGTRIDIQGSYKSENELSSIAKKDFERYKKGELSTGRLNEKEKLNDYEIIGSAKFTISQLKWVAYLELKKIKEPNKGNVQIVEDGALMRNFYDSERRAARFALDYGKRMVIGHIRGLKI